MKPLPPADRRPWQSLRERAATKRWLRSLPDDELSRIARAMTAVAPDAAKNAMRKASKNARIAHFHPHDLRHRCANLKIAEGVSDAGRGAARTLGNSLTLDTYSHFLLGD